MEFTVFLTRIFSYFHSILVFISNIFVTVTSNNIFKFTFLLGVFLFLLDFHFEIIGLLPRILGLRGERDKEYHTQTASITRSGVINGDRVTVSDTITKRKRVK